jgi:hydrogenase maturation protease
MTIRTVVLGVGNLLLTDDGVGIHAIRALEQIQDLPEGVELVDGGTAGLNLLCYLEGADRLIIIDAIQSSDPPGTIRRIAGAAVPAYMAMKISPHEITLPDLLASARLCDLYPGEVVVWGIKPESLDIGIELSPPLAAQFDTLVANVHKEILN